MKPTTLALVALVAFSTVSLSAQTAPAVKVDIKPPKIETIQSPQFQAGNVPNLNWRPKNWLMVDMELDIKLPQAAGGRNGSLPAMTVNYYLALGVQKDGKYQVIKGSLEYVDIPAAEKCHALAFVPPATMRRLLEKETYSNSDITVWGVEVLVDGQRVAADGSIKNPWWETSDKFIMNDNAMLPKKDTPYSILWVDYDLGVKNK